jgi:hypothetical protein
LSKEEAAVLRNEYQYNKEYLYVGKVMLYVNLGWYDPQVKLTDTGSLEIEGGAGEYQIRDKQDNKIINRISAFKQLVVAEIETGIIDTKEFIVQGIDLAQNLRSLEKENQQLENKISQLENKLEQQVDQIQKNQNIIETKQRSKKNE